MKQSIYMDITKNKLFIKKPFLYNFKKNGYLFEIVAGEKEISRVSKLLDDLKMCRNNKNKSSETQILRSLYQFVAPLVADNSKSEVEKILIKSGIITKDNKTTLSETK